MTSRAEHFRLKAKHAQRTPGHVAPKLPARDTDTTWIGPFISSLQGAQSFGVNAMIALPLGVTEEERSVKLRKLSSMGLLHMRVVRFKGEFAGYLWTLTEAGTF